MPCMSTLFLYLTSSFECYVYFGNPCPLAFSRVRFHNKYILPGILCRGIGIGLQDEIKAPIGLIIDDHLRILHGQLSYLCTDRFTVDRLTVGVTFGPGQGNEQDIWHRVHGEELDVHL